jgi:hypothetical protein
VDLVDTKAPDKDIIAVYLRETGAFFQIRIDFLDLVFPASQDIYIVLDTNPGGLDKINLRNGKSVPVGMNWDYLITIPATGNIQVINDEHSQVYGMGLLINKDTTQDNVVISFRKNEIKTISKVTDFQILVTPPNNESIIDQTNPTNIDAPSPSRAKVILAFWNAFSPYTPAETLRSWAGAHSGPLSSRHGLKYLLEAADQYKIPILILDLMTLENISALDYLYVLPWVNYLRDQKILVTSENFELFDIFGKIANFYKDIWYDNIVNDYAHNTNFTTLCLSPSDKNLSDLFFNQFLQCKSRLIDAALSPTPTIVNLGGDFTNSFLGDPTLSKQVFSYIYNHPWIQVTTAPDINKLCCWDYSYPSSDLRNKNAASVSKQPAAPMFTIAPSSVNPKNNSLIERLPNNHISNLAINTYISLTQRDSMDYLYLNANYINQISFLNAAARWAELPIAINSCDQDLDYDGKNECILSNNNIFTTIDPEGGYIPFVFSKDALGVHQEIGPTWEFVTGISDPSMWDLSLGVRSDPGQILGAFGDSFNDWNTYTVNLLENQVILTSSDLTIRKSFLLVNNNLHIEIISSKFNPYEITIPLVVDPWIRFTSGWGDKYSIVHSSEGIQWGISTGVNIEIISNSESFIYPFNETRTALSFPENPNFDYSLGHYLPYPMALVKIQPKNILTVDLQINP